MARARGFYINLAIGGFLFVPAGSALVGLAFLAVGQRAAPRGVIAQLTLLSLVCLVAAVVLRLTNRFLIPALVVGVLMLLPALGIGLEFGIRHPESFFDFVTTIITILGPLVAVVGSAVALVQRRRGTLRPARPAERRAVWAGLAVFVLMATTSGVLTYAGRATADAPPGAIVVETKVDEFLPSRIGATGGERLRVFVVNRDSYAHTFTIDDLAVDEYIGPRAQRLVTFRVPDDPRRRFVLACYVTGHGTCSGRSSSAKSADASARRPSPPPRAFRRRAADPARRPDG